MAGHSQFKNIMFRKGAQDKKRGKIFTKLIRELTTAARMGLPDPASNPRLRAAVLAARQANMSKDTVERAIKRGAGGEAGEAYDEVRYEGYAPCGVAVIVETLTDNRNRTASEVRRRLPNRLARSARPPQQRKFHVRPGRRSSTLVAAAGADDMIEAAIEAGADDADKDGERHVVTATVDDFNTVRDALEQRFGPAESARLTWRPKSAAPIDEETATSLFKLLETLEDSDDVQNVYANFEVAEDVLARLSG